MSNWLVGYAAGIRSETVAQEKSQKQQCSEEQASDTSHLKINFMLSRSSWFQVPLCCVEGHDKCYLSPLHRIFLASRTDDDAVWVLRRFVSSSLSSDIAGHLRTKRKIEPQ